MITGTDLANMDERVLLRRVMGEMRRLNEAGAGMRLDIHPATAFAVVAMCQLGMRHPGAAANASTKLVREFVALVRGKFEVHAPAVAEAIHRGDDPARDPEPK